MISKNDKILLKAKKLMLAAKIATFQKEYRDLCNQLTAIHKSTQNPKIYKNIKKCIAHNRKIAEIRRGHTSHDGQDKQ